MRPRRAEPRILDIHTDRRRYVGLRVTAEYLNLDVRTLKKLLAQELIHAVRFGSRQRIARTELIAFEARQRGEGSTANDITLHNPTK